VTSGYFVSREASAQAYGAWYCKASKGTDAGEVFIPLVGLAPVVLTASNFNGYVIRFRGVDEKIILYRYNNGVAATIGNAADSTINTEYELWTRRQSVATADGNAAGYFEVWIRGGIYVVWTQIITGTENTHTTSNCLVGHLDAGGTLSDYRQYPNGATLLPTDVPGLED
jgi:hypothetical protein